MAYSVSPRGISCTRYIISFQREEADGSWNVFHLYCESIKDVRDRLEFNLRSWRETAQEFSLTLSNGYTETNVPADMIKNQTGRHGSCLVARAYTKVDSGEIRGWCVVYHLPSLPLRNA